MTRSTNRLLPSRAAVMAVFVASIFTGCAFDDGNPWATAAFEVEASFDDADRLEAGRLATSKGYAVELDSIVVSLGAVGITAGAGEVEGFDPSNPPEGYGLCHGGHCHADDGRLVSYEEIAAELGGSVGGVDIAATIDQDVALDPSAQVEGECEACDLPRGNVTVSEIVVRQLTVSGTAYDTLDDPRIPEEGVEFDWTIDLDATLDAPLAVEIGKDYGGDLVVDGNLVVSAKLFDAIDFSAADPVAAIPEAFLEETLWQAEIHQP